MSVTLSPVAVVSLLLVRVTVKPICDPELTLAASAVLVMLTSGGTVGVGVKVAVAVGVGVKVAVAVAVAVAVGVDVGVGVGDAAPVDCLSWKASCWELPPIATRPSTQARRCWVDDEVP